MAAELETYLSRQHIKVAVNKSGGVHVHLSEMMWVKGVLSLRYKLD